MQNVFIEQPEFVTQDPRANRPATVGYNTNANFMRVRHQLLLPPKLIENKRILDLGSCNAASGAWCLSNGATYYKGVEFQESFVRSSSEALGKYYPVEKWAITQSSIEDYLSSDTEIYDVVLASGVLYSFSDVIGILNSMAKVAKALVIESMHPKTFMATEYLSAPVKKAFLNSHEYVRFMENEPFIAVGRQGMVMPDEKTIFFNGTKPSMGVVKFIIGNAGFQYIDRMNQALKAKIPDLYSPFNRFGLLFVRANDFDPEEYGFASAASGKSRHRGVHDWRNA